MFGLGTPELVLIISALLLFFGAGKLPELARGMGSGIREFKNATRDVTEPIEKTSIDY